MISIKTKLISLASLGVLSTAIILGWIAIFHITQITSGNSQDTLRLICVAEKEHLDITMVNIQHSVDSMSDFITREITDVHRFAANADYRAQKTKTLEALFYTIAEHTQSICSFYVHYDPNLVGKGNEGFWLIKDQQHTTPVNHKVTDLELYEKTDIEHVGWYYIPAWNGKPIWLTPYMNKNLRVYMISYVVPLYIQDTLIGVVGMDIDFSIIINEINQLSIYKNGYAYITNEREQIIYHKDYAVGETNIRSPHMLEYSLTLSNGWNLVVTVPKSEVYAERNRIISISLLVTIIIATIFILISIRITKRIIKPLLELATAARKISRGNLNVTLPQTTRDEVGILASAFKKTVQQLPKYMYYDSLTGVHNVSAYKQAVSKLEAAIANHEDIDFAIVVMDINNLKQTNDSYGHEVGNQLIVNATKMICAIFLHSTVYRIGGDEFVAILQHSDFTMRDDLMRKFDETAPTFTAAGKTFTVLVAHGMSVYDQAHDTSYTDVFKRADDAMYQNKKRLKELFS